MESETEKEGEDPTSVEEKVTIYNISQVMKYSLCQVIGHTWLDGVGQVGAKIDVIAQTFVTLFYLSG